MDALAIATGKVKEGCILKSAGGDQVTANILAKWNANIAKENCEWLNRFHTVRAGVDTAVNQAMDFTTFRKVGC